MSEFVTVRVDVQLEMGTRLSLLRGWVRSFNERMDEHFPDEKCEVLLDDVVEAWEDNENLLEYVEDTEDMQCVDEDMYAYFVCVRLRNKQLKKAQEEE